MQWFREARFGMFIHWGVCSLKGVELSWGRSGPRPYDINRRTRRRFVPEYDNLYKKWNPAKYDPDEWVAAARGAGMKYMVLGAKHHDGFSLFHTKYSDYHIGNSSYKKDIVRLFTDACHKADMKVGLYYSPRDWYHPDYLEATGGRPRNANYLDFYHGQMNELSTKYGRIDMFWFDSVGGVHGRKYTPRELEYWNPRKLIRNLRRNQPGVIINNRVAAVLGSYNRQPVELWGDWDTPEQRIGKMQTNRPWESCITLVGHQWSWKPNGKMLSLEECIHKLVMCAAGDGNLLLNVGPMPDGRIEPRQVKRLKEIGDWLAKYGQSIYKTRGGPLKPGKWGGVTHRGNTVFVHVLRWPKDGQPLVIPSFKRKVLKSRGLTTDKLTVRQTANRLEIVVPAENRDAIDTIVALELSGEK